MNVLIIGIVAAVCTLISFFGVPYVGFAGLILGIVAWVMGNNACKQDPNDDKAKAGKILGIVVTILAIVSIVVAIVIVGAVIGAAVA